MWRKVWLIATLLLPTFWSVGQAGTAYGPRPGYRAVYTIEMAETRVGRARFRIEKRDSNLISHLDVRFHLRRSGQDIRVGLRAALVFSESSLLPRTYQLQSLLNGAEQARIDVQMRADSAVATVRGAGVGNRRISVALVPGTLVLDNNFCVDHYQLLIWRFLRSGAQHQTVPFLVPQILLRVPSLLEIRLEKRGQQSISLGDSTFSCWKIVGTSAGGLQLIFLVRRRDGVLLRWEVPAQASVAELQVGSTAEDTTFSALEEERYLRSILDRFYIKSYADLGNWHRLAYLRLRARLQIVALGPPVRNTVGQTFEGRCEVQANTAQYDGVFTIQMVRNRGPGEWVGDARERFGKELSDEPGIQVSDSAVQAWAHKIAGDAETPWQAVKRVCQWVATQVRYKLTGADALTCLRTREGDCGPKAKLAIAFLRSLGIPARLAGGLLYAGGRWGQHNWVQVFLGDRLGWVPVDPTTDETDTFSAAHLTLWEGWAGALGAGSTPARLEVLEFRKLP